MRGEREKASDLVAVWHQPEEETRGREEHIGQICVLTGENHSHQVDSAKLFLSDRNFAMIAKIFSLISHLSILI